MYTHNIDPVLINILFFEIRWYSLAYIFGILFGWWYGKKIIILLARNNVASINLRLFDDLISYIIIGIIVGGRVGYVIFYNPEYFINHPFDVIKIWQGGMSFHGGLLGLIVAVVFFSKNKNVDPLIFLDVISCVAPLGLFLGRISNFINAELYGKPTEFYFSVIFPNIDEIPRHASQIYEAILEGLVLFIILNYIIHKKNYVRGFTSSLFLILYGTFRIICEQFREPDSQIGYLFDLVSMGSALSILMIAAGSYLFIKYKNDRS